MNEPTERINRGGRWPDLFERLSPQQRRAVVQSFAAVWHEGWEPNREDVRDVIEEMTGAIKSHEFERSNELSAAAAPSLPRRAESLSGSALLVAPASSSHLLHYERPRF